MTPSKRRGSGITLDPDELRYATRAADPAQETPVAQAPPEAPVKPPRATSQRDPSEGHGCEGHGCGSQADRGSRRARRRAVPRRGEDQDRNLAADTSQGPGGRRGAVRAGHRRCRRDRVHHRFHPGGLLQVGHRFAAPLQRGAGVPCPEHQPAWPHAITVGRCVPARRLGLEGFYLSSLQEPQGPRLLGFLLSNPLPRHQPQAQSSRAGCGANA